ncbi:MAG: DnaD domain protein [Bacillus sp. (in: Bacteria)]|nr:DnaD domain protein [Bacillus sp. (in: firmicutes)]
MSSLLLNDKPLIILPSLAEKIGLNESIVLQQLHYWLMDSNHTHDGHKWIYNTYSNWKDQFPFWSDKTIRRTITKLENMELIVTGNYNQLGIDKTKWYRIDYDLLSILTSPCGQNDQSSRSDCPIHEVKLTTPLPEITSEITLEEKEEEAVVEINPFRFFEENGFGTIGGYMAEKIGQWCDDLSPVLVLEAMKMAVERGAKNWSYVEKILRDWSDKKYKTVEQVHAAILAFKENQAKQRDRPRNGYKPIRKEIIPDWFDEPPQVQQEQNQISSEELNIKRKELEEKLKKFRK